MVYSREVFHMSEKDGRAEALPFFYVTVLPCLSNVLGEELV